MCEKAQRKTLSGFGTGGWPAVARLFRAGDVFCSQKTNPASKDAGYSNSIFAEDAYYAALNFYVGG